DPGLSIVMRSPGRPSTSAGPTAGAGVRASVPRTRFFSASCGPACAAYVLLNARKHFRQRWGPPPALRLAEASPGRWFDGWRRRPREGPDAGSGPRDVAAPRTWLLAAGWRRHGLIDPAEVPGG